MSNINSLNSVCALTWEKIYEIVMYESYESKHWIKLHFLEVCTKHGNQCLFTFTYAHKDDMIFRNFTKRTYRKLISAVQICFQDRRIRGPGGSGHWPPKILRNKIKKFISTTMYLLVFTAFFILQELEAKLEDMLQEKVPSTDEEFEVWIVAIY